MPTRYPAIAPTFPHLFHGGDYNPDQWFRTPEVWDEDMRLLKLAHCNTVTIGIFSWVILEPAEGQYEFGWLDRIMGMLAEEKIRVILATPGGAKPAWLAQKYPETLRVNAERKRLLWGHRHNHCFTSPAFRTKCQAINTRLAERYKDHPTLTLWHVNNEYSGECHCDLCQGAFRQWLRAKYHNDLEQLNRSWWNGFWSHTITDWSQIDSPSPIGEQNVHGHNLDWARFVTDQTIDCFKAEAAPLRAITPKVPITTNFFGHYAGVNCDKFSKEVDVVSWDSYPSYHDRPTDVREAAAVSFIHSQRRAAKGKPFILMESAPGQQNYKDVCKQKRPGVHILEGLQTIAHGSDSVLYFQWRKSRGGFEKFHGAVVDHYAVPDTRVFREVAELGAQMEKLDAVVGTDSPAEVGLIYDYENRWAIDNAAGPLKPEKGYAPTCHEHFRAFWQNGVNVDVISEDHDFTKYKLLVAPMLYMVRPGVSERMEAFARGGGTVVVTYFSGLVDENDLCFLTGFPGPLRKLCGVWAEEIDALYPDEFVPILPTEKGDALHGQYEGRTLCEVIHAEGADVVATYGGEFYAGTPAVTVNKFGAGRAFYIASRNDERFHDDFYSGLIDELKIRRATGQRLPKGVTAALRSDGTRDFVFLLNFTPGTHRISLPKAGTDAVTGEAVSGDVELRAYGSRVIVF